MCSPSNIRASEQKSGKVGLEAPEQQPLMATGVDRLGPPKQFPALQTPE
jgi:hypothetical protein